MGPNTYVFFARVRILRAPGIRRLQYVDAPEVCLDVVEAYVDAPEAYLDVVEEGN